MISLSYNKNIFIARCKFEEKDKVKSAGFRWDPNRRIWYTDDPEKAKNLKDYLTNEAMERINKLDKEKRERVQESYGHFDVSDFVIPIPPDKSLREYQKQGVYLLSKREHVLLADEMGLGKTIQTIAYFNILPKNTSILIIVPAFLKINWFREIMRWDTVGRDVQIITSSTGPIEPGKTYIINYDILKKHEIDLKRIFWDIVVYDEAHVCKNPKAQRTQIAMTIQAKKRIFVTGTPLLNRPYEIYTILKTINHPVVRNWKNFVERYCNGRKIYVGRGKYVWDYSGASNIEELNNILRSSIMIRRKKDEVLKELPEITREMIVLDVDTETQKLLDEEKQILLDFVLQKTQEGKDGKRKKKAKVAKIESYEDALLYISQKGMSLDLSSLSAIRKKIAEKKIPFIVDFIKDTLENEPCCVVFTWHKNIAFEITEQLKNENISAVCVTGELDNQKRQQCVDDFQNGQTSVLVATMASLGVGVTLTRARVCVFAELDWVPANILQAEARLHRFSQKNAVISYYVFYNNSIDALISKRLGEKEKNIDGILA